MMPLLYINVVYFSVVAGENESDRAGSEATTVPAPDEEAIAQARKSYQEVVAMQKTHSSPNRKTHPTLRGSPASAKILRTCKSDATLAYKEPQPEADMKKTKQQVASGKATLMQPEQNTNQDSKRKSTAKRATKHSKIKRSKTSVLKTATKSKAKKTAKPQPNEPTSGSIPPVAPEPAPASMPASAMASPVTPAHPPPISEPAASVAPPPSAATLLVPSPTAPASDVATSPAPSIISPGAVLNRGETQSTAMDPDEDLDMDPDTLDNLLGVPAEPKPKTPEKPKTSRDKNTHNRRNRFYRSLTSPFLRDVFSFRVAMCAIIPTHHTHV